MRGAKRKIVIVDDEEDLCFLLSQILRSYGFEVTSFSTLTDGLSAIDVQKPDWAIIDNNLPDGLGWEASRSILKRDPDIHLINISANPDSAKDIADPRVHYLIKPIDGQSIVELIRASA